MRVSDYLPSPVARVLTGRPVNANRDIELESGTFSQAQVHRSSPMRGEMDHIEAATPSPRWQPTQVVVSALRSLPGIRSRMPAATHTVSDSMHRTSQQFNLELSNFNARRMADQAGTLHTINEQELDSYYAKQEEELSSDIKLVLADKLDWQKSKKELTKIGAQAASTAALLTGTYLLVNQLIQMKVPKEHQATSQGFLSMAIFLPLFNESKKTADGVIDVIHEKGKLTYAEALEKTHLKRVEETRERLESGIIPSDARKAIHKIDLALKLFFSAARRGEKVKFGLIRVMMHWRQDFLVQHPVFSKEVAALKTNTGRKIFMSEMQHEMRRYTGHKHQKLCGFTVGIGARSLEHYLPEGEYFSAEERALIAKPDFDITEAGMDENWNQWKKVPEKPRQMLLMAGSTGCGKSNYTNKVLPKLLRLPVMPIVVPEIKKGGFSGLDAQEWLALEQEEFQTADTDAMGKFGLKLNRAGCTNPILNFEEVNLADSDGFKRFADPAENNFLATAMELNFDIAKSTMIFHLNSIKKAQSAPEKQTLGKLEPAMADRPEIVVFHKSERDTLVDKAKSAYGDWAALYCLPVKGGTALLKAEQQERLQSLYKGSMEYMIDYHHSVSKIHSARMMVTASSVINFIAWRLMQEEHLGVQEIDQQQVNDYIAEFYAHRMTLDEGSIDEDPVKETAAQLAEREQMLRRPATPLSSYHNLPGGDEIDVV